MTPPSVALAIAAETAELDPADYTIEGNELSAVPCKPAHREGCMDDAWHAARELLEMGHAVSIERGERDVVRIGERPAQEAAGAA